MGHEGFQRPGAEQVEAAALRLRPAGVQQHRAWSPAYQGEIGGGIGLVGQRMDAADAHAADSRQWACDCRSAPGNEKARQCRALSASRGSGFLGLDVAEQLLGEAHVFLHAFLHVILRQFGDVGLHGVGTMGQAAVVGDLDVQAGAGVELEDQRALFHVQHHVHADVAEAAQFVATGGQLHETVPVGQLHAIHGVAGIRVLADLVVQPGALEGNTGGQVDTDTNGTLVQVGLAVGLAGWQTKHGHHRVAHQHDDADVRYAFVANALEDRVRSDAIFDQRTVTAATQRVEAGEDAGDLLLDFPVADDLAGDGLVATLEAVGDHQDAIAAGTLGRLDHEVVVLADDLVELLDFLLGRDDPVQFRHMDAGLDRPLLGDDLVIDDRVQVPLVVLEYIVRVAPVDTHDAFGFKGLPRLPQADHGFNPSGRL